MKFQKEWMKAQGRRNSICNTNLTNGKTNNQYIFTGSLNNTNSNTKKTTDKVNGKEQKLRVTKIK